MIIMLNKKDFKILITCIGLVCLGFVYDNVCDYVMDLMESRTNKIKEETEYRNHIMNTIEEDVYNACGYDPYCGDLFIEV